MAASRIVTQPSGYATKQSKLAPRRNGRGARKRTDMRVLVACEFSGIVREAFRARGHDAWSCDLLPTEIEGQHWRTDVRDIMLSRTAGKFDLLIAFPPCTYLCNSGVRWLAPGGKLNAERHRLMVAACDFFAQLLSADIPRICVENPIMHKYARNYLQETWRVTRHDARPTQTIQPYEHGHGETKRTCLWLRGLPLLKPSSLVSGRTPRVHHASPGPDRWKKRSRTLPGIAKAMAEQWNF